MSSIMNHLLCDVLSIHFTSAWPLASDPIPPDAKSWHGGKSWQQDHANCSSRIGDHNYSPWWESLSILTARFGFEVLSRFDDIPESAPHFPDASPLCCQGFAAGVWKVHRSNPGLQIILMGGCPMNHEKFVLDADVALANQPVCKGYAESFDALDR